MQQVLKTNHLHKKTGHFQAYLNLFSTVSLLQVNNVLKFEQLEIIVNYWPGSIVYFHARHTQLISLNLSQGDFSLASPFSVSRLRLKLPRNRTQTQLPAGISALFVSIIGLTWSLLWLQLPISEKHCSLTLSSRGRRRRCSSAPCMAPSSPRLENRQRSGGTRAKTTPFRRQCAIMHLYLRARACSRSNTPELPRRKHNFNLTGCRAQDFSFLLFRLVFAFSRNRFLPPPFLLTRVIVLVLALVHSFPFYYFGSPSTIQGSS